MQINSEKSCTDPTQKQIPESRENKLFFKVCYSLFHSKLKISIDPLAESIFFS